jgi:HEAT repeat protein
MSNIRNAETERTYHLISTTLGDGVTRFGEAMPKVAIDLETRSDEALVADCRYHADEVVREQALYSLVRRQGVKALPALEYALLNDANEALRINALWLLEGMQSEKAPELGTALLSDPSSRVREWARVFAWEKGWVNQDFRVKREAQYHENRTFDQTIFLHITCDLYIRLTETNELWGRLVMSPQMLARVYGQAYACPIVRNRESQIVIAKTLKGLHADGSDHYESFLFRGFTERTSAHQGNFYFETHTKRPFYVSGKADDVSEGVIHDVVVPFAREGQWFLNENINLKGGCAIEYVRGLFQGWAYVNFARIQKSGGEFFFPGNSVLSTLHHPVVGKMTNAFLTGGFKGKVVDWNDDGVLDLNYLQSPSTAEGEVDSNFDGIADVPGMSVCNHPFQK